MSLPKEEGSFRKDAVDATGTHDLTVHKPQAVMGDIVLKLKALLKSMSKLNVRRKKCEIRVGEMKVELGEAAVEKNKMRMRLFYLIRNAHTARGKLNMQVARMKVQVHIEWMEELDAWGKRLQVEVNELLQKDLEELEVLEE